MAVTAAQISNDRRRRALLELRAGLFVRTTGIGKDDTIEPYHDRVREVAVTSLGEERERVLHLSLAQELDSHAMPESDSVFALAHHYFHAHSDKFADRGFACNSIAAERAAQNYAFEQSYRYSEQALQIAEQNDIPPDVRFYVQLSDSAAHCGHMDSASEAIDQALGISTDPRERAELFLAASRSALSRIDTNRARVLANAALAELGTFPEKQSIPRVLYSFYRSQRSLGKLLHSLPLTGPELAKRRLFQRIGTHLIYVSYFAMDTAGLLQSHISTMKLTAGLGSSTELATFFLQRALLCAILDRRSWAEQTLEYSRIHLEEENNDPLANAHQSMVRAVIHNFLGDVQLAQSAMTTCLDNTGHLMENQDFFTATADLSWNLIMRGYTSEAWSRIEQALAREKLSARSHKGHTYRCYAGPVLAILGRPEEGLQILDSFRELIESVPADRWRVSQHLAHRIFYNFESGSLGQEFEDSVDAFAKLGHSPKRLPQQMRHVYVAIAYARLQQLEMCIISDKTRHLRLAKNAIRTLGKSARHPTMVCHHKLAKAKLARLQGKIRKSQTLLDEAKSQALNSDNPWVLFLVESEHAAMANNSIMRSQYHSQALAFSEAHHWPHRFELLRSSRDIPALPEKRS